MQPNPDRAVRLAPSNAAPRSHSVLSRPRATVLSLKLDLALFCKIMFCAGFSLIAPADRAESGAEAPEK
jgi:hypothetical protein